MPSRCVAAGCSNTSSESVSVYKFPKQETLLKQWTKQVQRTRANWVPTASSTLCSEHFEADCFEETPQLIKDMGMHVRYKKVLKPNAIPTIFKRSLVATSETETPSTSTGSSQYKKRKSTMPEVVEISTQTDEDFCPLCDHKQLSIQVEPIIPSSPDLPSSQPDPVSADDSDYLPSSSQTPSSSDSESRSTPPPTERFFLVAWSALSMLLNLRCCAFCQEMDMDMSTTTQGTMLCVLWTLLLFPGLRKKLVALSKEKDCTDLKEWIDSIINHLYWSVMSTDSAEPNLVEAKWTSVLNHIVNIHTHNNELFPKCEHKRLRGRAARKKWLKPCKYVLYILHSRIFFFYWSHL
uniref:THAP-type domain-containing protein n=1 Tax=Oryzias latipes TaxID=8090 RepID=A0A3P9M265_ORYLA